MLYSVYCIVPHACQGPLCVTKKCCAVVDHIGPPGGGGRGGDGRGVEEEVTRYEVARGYRGSPTARGRSAD